MNNKNGNAQRGCGCQQEQYLFGGCDQAEGFVPVVGNWDFNLNGTQRPHRCNAREACGETRSTQAARCETNACTGAADCPCDACAQRRAARNRQADCPCQAAARQKNKADNLGVGMMWAKVQALDTIYDGDHALQAGTLYPELHMPLNGYWPCDENCADHVQKTAFMLWELRLYLNTHPNDKEALALF